MRMNRFAALIRFITRGYEVEQTKPIGVLRAYRDEEDRFCVRLSTYDKELAKRLLAVVRKEMEKSQ